MRWNGYTNSGYFCEPANFIGTDAKLVRGALVNETSTSQNLLTLSNSSSPYQVGRQPFSITNSPSTPDGSFDEVRGTVVNDNIKYSFNLGSIMVNSQMINFDDDIDTTIGGGEELNEQLVSKPFLLNDDDTLIIGRNAFYLDEGGGEFTEVQYAVYLTKNTSGEKFLELARDTIHAGDSIQIEFLEGFIIQNIPGGSDSFYVQMEIDTVWAGGGDGFGLNNISNNAGGEGDNTAMKKYVFWKNANVVTNNIPTEFVLYQNFPNPFNPITKIKYDIPPSKGAGGMIVKLIVYDLLGREVVILVNNEFKTAGRYEINWNAMNFASGVYIYRIQVRQAGSSAEDYVSTKKMVLIK